jgi:hypothetical protein
MLKNNTYFMEARYKDPATLTYQAGDPFNGMIWAGLNAELEKINL